MLKKHSWKLAAVLLIFAVSIINHEAHADNSLVNVRNADGTQHYEIYQFDVIQKLKDLEIEAAEAQKLVSDLTEKLYNKETKNFNVYNTINSRDFWKHVHVFESNGGKKLIQKNKKYTTCKWTSDPCGHLQLARVALKDIGKDTKKWRTRRMNYNHSVTMAKQYLRLVYGRLPPEYKQMVKSPLDLYHLHQQSNNGFVMKNNLANGVPVKDGLSSYARKRISSTYINKALYNNIPKAHRKGLVKKIKIKRKGKKDKVRYVIKDEVVHRFNNYWLKRWNSVSSTI